MRICFTLLIVTLGLGCESRQHAMIEPTEAARGLLLTEKDPSMTEREIRSAIEHATGADCAIIYINMAWSLTSVDGMPRYAQLMMDYYRRRPGDNLLFHLIDCTAITNDYSPLTDIPDWDNWNAENRKFYGGQGNGELIWLKQGRVVEVKAIGEIASVTQFIQLTEQAMK